MTEEEKIPDTAPPLDSDALQKRGQYGENLEDLATPAPTSGQLAASDVKRHGGALTGAVVGGAIGSFVPIVGTIGGALVGAVVGHLRDRRRQ